MTPTTCLASIDLPLSFTDVSFDELNSGADSDAI